MNKITIWGRVKANAKVLETIAFLNIYESKKINEEWKYTSYSIKCFKDNINRAATFTKGDKIVVYGSIDSTNVYTNTTGESRISIEVVAQRLDILITQDESRLRPESNNTKNQDSNSFNVNTIKHTQDKGNAFIDDIDDKIPF